MIPTNNMHFIFILGMQYQGSRKLNLLVDIKPHWLITILFMCHLVTFAQNYSHTQYWLHVQNIFFSILFPQSKITFLFFSDVKSEKPRWQRAWFQRKVWQTSYLLVNTWNWSYRTEIRHTNTGRPCEKFDTVSFFFYSYRVIDTKLHLF